MKGLYIFPEGSGEWPSTSRFYTCFEPVMRYMSKFFWLAQKYQSGPFDYVRASENYSEEFLEGLFVDIPNERGNVVMEVQLLRPDFLPELAPYIYQDSIDLVGLRGPELAAIDTAGGFLQLSWSEWHEHKRSDSEEYKLIDKLAQVCFFCEDGRSWEIYAKDHEILNAVAKHISKTLDLKSEYLELFERDQRLSR